VEATQKVGFSPRTAAIASRFPWRWSARGWPKPTGTGKSGTGDPAVGSFPGLYGWGLHDGVFVRADSVENTTINYFQSRLIN
jgi:hypothetical protein